MSHVNQIPTDHTGRRRTAGADLATWERRRRAAWIDYLRATRGARGRAYHDLEAQAWEQLRRRLRRNDELAADGAAGPPARA